MSFGLASKRNIQSKLLSAPTPYVRNPSWPVLPPVTSTDNKFVGLHKVDVDSNFVALSAAGNYTVDWGDGSPTENIATGIIAQHQYFYTAAGLANTNAPVTLTDSEDLVTRTAHGYSNGNTVSFYNIVSTTGLIEAQIYYVINATPNTFQASATQGGTAVALTTNGTATLLPYKLAIVTVTPQAGQSFTSINLNKKHTQPNLGKYSSGFLDIIIAGSLLTTIQIGSDSSVASIQNILFSSLKQANRVTCNVPVASFLFASCFSLETVKYSSTTTSILASHKSMFQGCSSLTSVPLFNTAAVTSMANMFDGCSALTSVPLFNTAKVTSMANMFQGCSSLTSVPLFNTVAVTTMSGMFSGCSSLLSVPLFNTAAVVSSMNIMFQNCGALTSVPLFDTAKVNSMAFMFAGCSSLLSVPLFNTSAVTTMDGMFYNCSSLISVPLFNTSLVTIMLEMFLGCSSLTTVRLFNTTAVTTMAYMFKDCVTLTTVPLFNTAAVTTMGYMFSGCGALTSVPLFNVAAVSSVTNFSNMFSGCTSLSKATLSGTRFSISYTNCKLSEIELNSIMDNLSTIGATPSQSLTITQNWGAVTPVSLTCSTLANSTTITAASTTGVVVGMEWRGQGSSFTTAAFCTLPTVITISSTITRSGHGLSNGDEVSIFSGTGLIGVTGLFADKIYYVVGAAINTFQLALTPGGTAILFTTTTTNSSISIRYRSVVTAVSPTQITVSRPATANGSFVSTFRTLKTQTASLKGWGVSG